MSKPKSNSLSFMILAFVALLMLGVGDSVMPAAAPAQEDRPVAFLAAVQGKVEIQRGDRTLEGTFGGPLHAGDILRTGPDSKAAFIYDSEGGGNGQVWELGPGSSIRIGQPPTGVAAMTQVPEGYSEKLDQFVRDASGEAGLSALPNMRAAGDGDGPEPLSPRDSKIAPDQVTFSWKPVEDALEYRVALSGEGVQAGSHATSEPEWIPDTGFEPGGKWAWQVEAITPDGPIASKEVSFEVATREQVKNLTDVQEQMDSLLDSKNATEVDTGLYLLGTYCQNERFFNQAISHFENLVSRHPGRKELHLRLGILYMAVGQNDKAIEQRRLATGE